MANGPYNFNTSKLPPENRTILTSVDMGSEHPERGERRSGRTTRIADTAVQIILSGGVCLVRDHIYFDRSLDKKTIDKENRRLAYTIIYRIKFEHPIEYKKLNFNQIEMLIWLS